MGEKIYTLESLAEYLGCKVRTIYGLTSAKKIGFFTIGSRKNIRFTQSQVDDYIKSRTKKSMRDIEQTAVSYCARKPLSI